MQPLKSLLLLLAISTAHPAELRYDFGSQASDEVPRGFQSLSTSAATAGEWRVVWDELEPAFPPLLSDVQPASNRLVLTQQKSTREGEDLFFCMYEAETFGDFTLTSRVKIEPGTSLRAAGIAFRFRDPSNFYAIGLNAAGSAFVFFKEVGGVRGTPIQPAIEIEPGVWHELKIEARGNRMNLFLNGSPALPELTDASFNAGQIGFWTRANTRAWFADTFISYVPREGLPEMMVREALERYPRLLGVRIYARPPQKDEIVIVASSDPGEYGLAASQMEKDVIQSELSYFSRGPQSVMVTLPLRDRNGEAAAAVQVVMRTFRGQTESNAVGRALPVARLMESHLRKRLNLFE